MKIKYIVIAVLLITLSAIVNMNAQSVVLDIIRWDNTEKKVELNLLNKLTFTADDLILNYQAGAVENVTKSEIRKLVFGNSTGTNAPAVQQNIQVFPNPAHELISVKNLPEKLCQVNIYSITGTQVLSVQLNSVNQQINIGELPKGLYFLKANNQATKFTKQ